MKHKQLLIAALPAAVTAAVILMNVFGENKADAMYAKAYQAAQTGDYSAAVGVLNDLQNTAPDYVPQYELAAQIYMDMGDADSARDWLQAGIETTGSKRLIQAANSFGVRNTPESILEGWNSAFGLQEEETLVQETETGLDVNFIVRYQGSSMKEPVQLQASSNEMTWTSSDPEIAQVDEYGLVTCDTSHTGEAEITGTMPNGEVTRCWVYVLDPEIYSGSPDEWTLGFEQYYFFPEGNLSIEPDSPVWASGEVSAQDILPRMAVGGEALSGGGAQGGTAESPQAVLSDLVDQNGNPLQPGGQPVVTPTPQPGQGGLKIDLGWKSIYFSGEYRIPDTLRYNGRSYAVTAADMAGAYSQEMDILSVPAGITDLGFGTQNPLSGHTGLEQILVDQGNPSYRSIDGILFSADGKTLLAYPASAPREEYTVPEGVTELGVGAFQSAKNLKSLTIPATVTKIDPSTCNFMTALETMTVNASLNDLLELDYLPQLKEMVLNGPVDRLYIRDCPNLERVVINGECSVIDLEYYQDDPTTPKIELNAPVENLNANYPVEVINPENAGRISEEALG